MPASMRSFLSTKERHKLLWTALISFTDGEWQMRSEGDGVESAPVTLMERLEATICPVFNEYRETPVIVDQLKKCTSWIINHWNISFSGAIILAWNPRTKACKLIHIKPSESFDSEEWQLTAILHQGAAGSKNDAFSLEGDLPSAWSKKSHAEIQKTLQELFAQPNGCPGTTFLYVRGDLAKFRAIFRPFGDAPPIDSDWKSAGQVATTTKWSSEWMEIREASAVREPLRDWGDGLSSDHLAMSKTLRVLIWYTKMVAESLRTGYTRVKKFL